jgi:hypothetical protein
MFGALIVEAREIPNGKGQLSRSGQSDHQGITQMHTLIDWESTGDGGRAELRHWSHKPALSRSYVEGLVKDLMHDVIMLSADFVEDETVTYGRCTEVSVFGKASAEFYGLYHESAPGASPAYCLRRCEWNGDFRDLGSVLAGLSAKSVFFNMATLTEPHKRIIEELDAENVDEGEIVPLLSPKMEFGNSKINYFFVDQNKSSMRSYRRFFASNERVEKVFGELKLMHAWLSGEHLVSPLPNSFKVRYSSDLLTSFWRQIA